MSDSANDFDSLEEVERGHWFSQTELSKRLIQPT
jgi:hypothetical protein